MTRTSVPRASFPFAVFLVSSVTGLAGCDSGDPDASLVEESGEAGETEDTDAGIEAEFDPEGVDPEFTNEEDPSEIVGPGTVTDTDISPRWPQVVRICSTGGCCSGTLVSRVHVLTAGHCAGAGGTVQLEAQAGSVGSAATTYNVIQWQTLSGAVASGSDLALVLLDRAVPRFGTRGTPDFSVEPAFAFASLSNTSPNHSVGYGMSTVCSNTGSGTRRYQTFTGGFSTYAGSPGVITRSNPGCVSGYQGPQPGDSGGPLMDVIGRVVGVFSGWSCRQASGARGGTGCTGTIEWTGMSAANTAWLNTARAQDFDGDGIGDVADPRPGLDCRGSSPPAACASVRPDFEVTNIASGGCTGTGGDPVVAVTVRNNGPLSEDAWVDVFLDRPSAPTPGTVSTLFRMSNILEERQTQTLYFTVDPASDPGRVDVIVDTTRSVTELNEGNNVRSASIDWPDCSFG